MVTLVGDSNSPLYAVTRRIIFLMLLSGQRGQTIHLLKRADIHVEIDKIVIYFTSLLKHSKPTKHLEPLVLKKYAIDEKLCVVRTVVDYIARTSVIEVKRTDFSSQPCRPIKGYKKHIFSLDEKYYDKVWYRYKCVSS